MSLSISIKTPEGLVLASDSRLSIVQTNGTPLPDTAFFDSGAKVFCLAPPNTHVACSYVGTAAAGVRSVGSLVREYGESVGVRKTVEEIARELHARLPGAGIKKAALTVSGFDQTNFYGRMFRLELPGTVTELFSGASWGIATGGKDELAKQVIAQIKPALELMPLSASADMAAWFIDLTTTSQLYSVGVASVGGRVQTAILERSRPAQLV